MSRSRRFLILALVVFTLTAKATSQVSIGPVPGMTTAWHRAPETIPIPLASNATTLTFKHQVHPGASITWSGAREVSNTGGWSYAVCHLDTAGPHLVSVEYVRAQGRKTEERCLLEVVRIRPEEIKVSIKASVEPIALDEADLNASAYRYFNATSIAALRKLSNNRYRTSIKRQVNLSLEVDPPLFAPLIEWRNAASRVTHLGTSLRMWHSRPRVELLSVGPVANPETVRLETYSVKMTSHASFQDFIPEGLPVTFKAVTNPAGFEDDITWLASTKYGSSDPVMGEGPEFTVRFEDTWGPHPGTGMPFQWLGVRADNAVFNQDQKPFRDEFCSTGEITLRIFPGILPDYPEGLEETLFLSSEGLMNTVILRTAPPYVDGIDIETEITELELEALSPTLGPLLFRLREDVFSGGAICDVEAAENGAFVSGDSYFEIFVEVELSAFGLVLDTGDEPVRLQAGAITELPPFGRGYLPQPPTGGVCDQPGGPQTVPLFLPGVGQLGEIIHALHMIDCPPPDQEDKCKITLTKIEGARENDVGKFDQLPDPHNPGRIFLDSVTDRNILANPDEQNVTAEVLLTPATLDPTKFEVLWEVRDPDDPADHKDVDPNDNGTPTGGNSNGGDNIDKLPEEAGHFFRMANHAIANQMSPGSDGVSSATVIGKANTEVDGTRRSTVKFHYSDEGGDNYVITAHCVEKESGDKKSSDETGILTVWRKRMFKVTGMVKTADDRQRIKTGVAGANAISVNVLPGANAFIDSYLQGDDKYTNNAATEVRVGTDIHSNTAANNGGASYYPGVNLAGVRTALQASYASPTANRACYVDLVVEELATNTAYQGVMTEARGTNNNTDEHTYAMTATTYHSGGGNNTHPNNTYQILGMRTFGAIASSLGTSVVDPHIYVNLLIHYQLFQDRETTVAEIDQTTVHESGHNVLPEAITFHAGHSAAPHDKCCGSASTGQGVQWCPKHARKMRGNVTRSFANHDPAIDNPAETATDSVGAGTKVDLKSPGKDFAAGGSTTITVQIQDADGVFVHTDNSTQITFSPTLSGTITTVNTGTGDGIYGVPGGAETITVANGVATVTVSDAVAETFQVTFTNNGGLTNPPNDMIMVTP